MPFDYDQNIAVFISLLENQASLFSPADYGELEKLIDSLPDDNEVISREISTWYENKPEILDAQIKLMFIESLERTPGSKKGQVPQPDPNINKKALENAIKRSNPKHYNQNPSVET